MPRWTPQRPCGWGGSALWVLGGAEPHLASLGHIQAERQDRHHVRHPLRSARRGVSSHAWGLPVTWEGHSPWTRTQSHWARGPTSTRGSLWTAPLKTSNATLREYSSLRPTHSRAGPPSLHLPHTPGPALLPLGAPHTARLRPVPAARCPPMAPRLRAYVGRPQLRPGPDPAFHQAAPAGPGASTSSHFLATPPGDPAPGGRSVRPGPGWGHCTQRAWPPATAGTPTLIFCSFGSESLQTRCELDLNWDENK